MRLRETYDRAPGDGNTVGWTVALTTIGIRPLAAAGQISRHRLFCRPYRRHVVAGRRESTTFELGV